MPDDVFKKLLEFEKILKKCIIDRFRGILPQHKIDIINNTEYLVKDELVKFSSGIEIQGKILRDMLDSIIDIKFIKNVPIDDFTETYILFAEDIENEILEYYSKDISIKYKFNVNFTKNDFSYANEMKLLLGNDFDYVMINKSTEELLNDERLKNFSKFYELKVMNLFAKADVQSPIVEIIDKSDDEITNNSNLEEVVYLDDITSSVLPNKVDESGIVQASQEIDKSNENMSLIQDVIIDVVAESSDPKEIINDSIEGDTTDKKTDDDDINLVELQSDNTNISSNNDDINLIEVKPAHSETNDSNEISNDVEQQSIDNYSILSDEQYKELCLKYARDENITEEELSLLLKSTPHLLDSNQEDIEITQSKENAMQSERKVRGFTNNSFSTYFIIISIILSLLLIYFML